MKILWITNIPSPYRVDFFNEMGKSCDLTVLFEKAGSTDRDKSWLDSKFEHFEGVIMRGFPYSPDSAVCPDVLFHLTRQVYDAVVITNFSSPTGALAIAYLKMTRKRYYLESDGGFASSTRLKSWIKRAIIKGARGYFSTSDVHDEYYSAYGARPHELIRYPFTSIHAEEVLNQPPTAEQKLAAKQVLGTTRPNLILSIGSFIDRKGFDALIKASRFLAEDTAVCIVGGDPPEEYIQLVTDLGLSSVQFVGFRERSELSLYFTAADLFVLPTREDIWGLVINEALAHALPVVTTDRCIAGLELVAKNDCGRIVPVDEVETLAHEINTILEDVELRAQMQSNALRVGRAYTIERMAQRHIDVLTQGVDGGVNEH